MIYNYLCKYCDKRSVCKIADIIVKFSDEAKNNLGIDITMNECQHYVSENEDEGTDTDSE